MTAPRVGRRRRRSDAAAAGAFRGAGFAPKAGRSAGWISLALAIVLWQPPAALALVNPLFLPTPLAIARAIWQLAVSGALWQHLSYRFCASAAGGFSAP